MRGFQGETPLDPPLRNTAPSFLVRQSVHFIDALNVIELQIYDLSK